MLAPRMLFGIALAVLVVALTNFQYVKIQKTSKYLKHILPDH